MREAKRGFTLIELLVVIGIIAVLVGLLLPVISAARREARAVQCASNVRQITAALINYAADWKGAFPPNSVEIHQYWFSGWTMGKYVRKDVPLDGQASGGVLVCPDDEPPVARSYSMNTYASSYVSSFVRDTLDGPNPPGKLWKSGVGQSSNMILMVESFSTRMTSDMDPAMPTSGPDGFATYPIIGWIGDRPAHRFGADRGAFANSTTSIDFGRWGPTVCQINYARHRKPGGGSHLYGDAFGRANIGFADGHVELLRHDELADFTTGKSRFRAMWSPNDREID